MMQWLEPDWPAPPRIRAASTLRIGGHSEGDFAGLNPAAHVGDDDSAVNLNRGLLHASLRLPAEPVWLNQVHGARAVRADRAIVGEAADASYTRESGVVCAVLTADCLPLLLCSRTGDSVAAVHGGWRGLLAGVIESTVAAMGGEDVIAWLGPAIGPRHFAVGGEVRAAFLEKTERHAGAFHPQEDGKWLANIYAIARTILAGCGVTGIHGGDFCTYSDADRFFSYRRDGGRTGRMATLIWRE